MQERGAVRYYQSTHIGCFVTIIIDGAEPVMRIERAAHAQRQRGNVHNFVCGHFFFGFQRNAFVRFFWDGGRFRPFCLASLCRTGYRKE